MTGYKRFFVSLNRISWRCNRCLFGHHLRFETTAAVMSSEGLTVTALAGQEITSNSAFISPSSSSFPVLRLVHWEELLTGKPFSSLSVTRQYSLSCDESTRKQKHSSRSSNHSSNRSFHGWLTVQPQANGRKKWKKKIGPLARNCRWTLLTQLTDRF